MFSCLLYRTIQGEARHLPPKRPLQHRPRHRLDLRLRLLLVAADSLDLGLHGIEVFGDAVLFVCCSFFRQRSFLDT